MGLKIVPGESGYMNLTTPQRETIQHVERFGASLSLAGVALIFVAYALFKRLRTVPNTFIVFASIANVGATTACLIGYAGIIAGDDSGLCRVQAFLLEMFMQSDPWWSLAMAVNVYMVFFMAANPNSFREYIWVYCLICFGLPLLPAVICLFYAPNNVRIYGNATLWCWIGDTYNQLRIFLYYLPIWMCIVLSAVIYVAVGYHVFHQRNQLRNLTLSNQAKDLPGTDAGGSAEKVSPAKMPFPPSPSVLSSRRRDQSWAAATTSTSTSHDPTSLPGCYGTVTTEVQVTAESSDNQTPPSTPTPSIAPVLQSVHPTAPLHDWTSRYDDIESCSPMSPISTNPFMTISSISSSHVRERRKGKKQRFRVWHKFVGKLHNLDPIKLAYLRTSFVFAISVLVTWTPSSINRVFSIAHPSATSFKLNLASAVVLPLQGVWNAVIFCATSWAAAGLSDWAAVFPVSVIEDPSATAAGKK
ncbi:hypothetical protein B0T24DRAFT_645338 [Lasiosphaeria ovina]|uniref:G-protein coupled receptors family 2 profile 2 domain-containing protein n=1 Tax=Lasiosphaeria ovina TaxID=92902 RepID=A0AAE0NJL6_9PEZI|nr:hypothetical protein B0T24DRAFT_645338 [Lasiosphaeria ovina]